MQGTNIIADGHIVEVRYQGTSGDFFSLTDIARYRTIRILGMSFRTGCVTAILFASLDFGNGFIMLRLIASNSRQLKANRV